MRKWYLHAGDGATVCGPYDLQEIEQFLREGRITAATPVCAEGESAWLPLGPTLGPALGLASASTALVVATRTPPVREETAAIDVLPPAREDDRFNWFSQIVPSITWIFRSPARVALLVLAMLVPGLGVLVARGWRVVAIRRLCRREPNPLPGAADIGAALWHGLVLCVTAIAYSVPFVVLDIIFGLRIIGTLGECLGLLWSWLTGNEAGITLGGILGRVAVRLAASALLPLLHFATFCTIYRCAVIRYAITGRHRCFLQLWTNTRMVLRHGPEFMAVFAITFVTGILLTIAAVLLAVTGIGLFLIQPTMVLLGFTTTAFLLARLAQRIAAEEIRASNPVSDARR